MNISTTLDIMIALVIVLLSLSLVVQSVQGALKKVLKLKSRQLEQSLVDLFHIAVGSGNTAQARMPLFQMRSGPEGLPAPQSGTEVRVMYDAVMKGFQEIGRVAASGKTMMDSISKSDLLKVLQRISPDSIMPGGGKALLKACQDVAAVKAVLEEVQALATDSAIRAKLAILREKLTPLLNDVQRIFDGQGMAPTVIVSDLVNLRGFKAAEILELLASVQTKVKDDLLSARGKPEEEELSKLSVVLDKLNTNLHDAGQSAEAAVGLLGARLKQVEDWFDTVMQGFEERYNRGMRTWGIVVSILVALTLNANLFRIYRNIASSPAKREVILRSKEEALKGQQGSAAESPAIYDCEKSKENPLEQAVCAIDQSSTVYLSYGFGWPPWNEIRSTVFKDGSSIFLWLLGCLATGLLLSVGAPFWEDVLESLFGVKNLLRKGGNIRPAESGAGQGLPKPA
jgi:hypothetical protein